MGVSSKSLVRVVWHDKINQILVACSDAKTHVLYSPEYSTKGALLSVGRRARRKESADFMLTGNIQTPHALPLFQAAPSKRKQMEKDRRDPIKSRKPQPPLAGVTGAQGRVSDNSTQHFMMKTIIAKKPRRGMKSLPSLLFSSLPPSASLLLSLALLTSQRLNLFVCVCLCMCPALQQRRTRARRCSDTPPKRILSRFSLALRTPKHNPNPFWTMQRRRKRQAKRSLTNSTNLQTNA